MRVLNIGSLNIDYVYSVDHIILPGETEDTGSRNVFLGGKGINQSCAVAKAGVEVWHGGLIGEEGKMFLDACDEYGVNRTYIRTVEGPNGHTVIQIDKNAQNSILLFGGANQRFTKDFIDEILANFTSQDILLLQNEVNLLAYMVDRAYEKGMTIVLNPSPFNDKLKSVDMGKVSIFILNEVEGFQLTGENDPDKILQKMHQLYPNARIMLTLGKDGAVYFDGEQKVYQPIFPVQAVDTTAAGDTFTGYFLAGLVEGLPIPEILKMSAKASSICVTRPGAVPSVPYRAEVMEALK
ncbi:MAG: ribokinase [Oscillospiraceae bacterium]|nr:ribokinase [Oscillospiraceae bacterium]